MIVGNKDSDSVSLFDSVNGALLAPLTDNGQGGLNYANGVAVSPHTGNMLVASVFTASIKEFAHDATGCGSTYVREFATGIVPAGIAFGSDGDLYATDYNNDRILRFDGVTGQLDPTFLGAGCGLDAPNGLLPTPCGRILVASYNTDQILAFDTLSGASCTVAASGCGLDGPFSLAFLPNGHLLVTNFLPDSVVEFDLSLPSPCLGNFVQPHSCGLDGPQGMVITPAGNVLVASHYTDSVLEFSGIDGEPAAPCVLATGCPMNNPTFMVLDRECGNDSECGFGSTCNQLGICQSSSSCPVGFACSPSSVTCEPPACSGIQFSDPPSCSIAAGQPHSLVNPGMLEGASQLNLTLEPDCGMANITEIDFVLSAIPGPMPVGFEIGQVSVNGLMVTVQFTHPMPPGHWTCVTHVASGEKSCNGVLPGDCNGDGASNSADIASLSQSLQQDQLPAYATDVNRSGATNSEDLIQVINLLNGAGAFSVWLGATLPACP